MKALRFAWLGTLGMLAPMTIGFAADSPAEAANKQLVLDYYRDIEAVTTGGKFEELPKVDAKYRDPGYIQHSVLPKNPAGGAPRPVLGPPKLLSIMAEGDKVIQVTSRTISDANGKSSETIIFNMFRVRNGKLIEHWDAFGTPTQSK